MFKWLQNLFKKETPEIEEEGRTAENVVKTSPSKTSNTTPRSVIPSDVAPKTNRFAYADSSSVDNDERRYYKPDEYYTYYAYPEQEDCLLSDKVIPFEERKAISFPSSNGLYPAEIALLHYCNKGDYPKPSSGYPGLWWFDFGIRDVGHALSSIMNRGFLRWATPQERVGSLKTDEMKKILNKHGLPMTGRKETLAKRILENITLDKETIITKNPKYTLTEQGQQELQNNEYVPYMMAHKCKTIENRMFGKPFNVWEINKLFRGAPPANWIDMIAKIEKERFGYDYIHGVYNKEQKEESSPHRFPLPDPKVLSDIPLRERAQYNLPKSYIIESIDIHPRHNRIPLDNIQNKNDWKAGFDEGSPFYFEGEYYRKKKEYRIAIYFYEQARQRGYLTPALYKGFVSTYNQLKDYENTIEILDEEVAAIKINDYGIKDNMQKRQLACERLRKKREKEQASSSAQINK